MDKYTKDALVHVSTKVWKDTKLVLDMDIDDNMVLPFTNKRQEALFSLLKHASKFFNTMRPENLQLLATVKQVGYLQVLNFNTTDS